MKKKIDTDSLKKISLFCNVKNNCVIPALNASSIYEVPSLYHNSGLDNVLLTELGYDEKLYPVNLNSWNNVVSKINGTTKEVSIAVVGKYTDLKDSYKSLYEALVHGSLENNVKLNVDFINSEKSKNQDILNRLSKVNGILVPGGFGDRGIEGKITSIKYARENNIPFFGICLGMQLAVIEISRNLLNLNDANSTEFSETSNPVVGLMTEWTQDNMKIQRSTDSDKGGTMRLGSYPCNLLKGSKINTIYKSEKINERHRHRYEVNLDYVNKFKDNGFIYSGMSPDKLLPEILESLNHKWFIGVQFHPELKSRPQNPHPLFISFVKACISKE